MRLIHFYRNIPSFSRYCRPKTVFRNFLRKYSFFLFFFRKHIILMKKYLEHFYRIKVTPSRIILCVVQIVQVEVAWPLNCRSQLEVINQSSER